MWSQCVQHGTSWRHFATSRDYGGNGHLFPQFQTRICLLPGGRDAGWSGSVTSPTNLETHLLPEWHSSRASLGPNDEWKPYLLPLLVQLLEPQIAQLGHLCSPSPPMSLDMGVPIFKASQTPHCAQHCHMGERRGPYLSPWHFPSQNGTGHHFLPWQRGFACKHLMYMECLWWSKKKKKANLESDAGPCPIPLNQTGPPRSFHQEIPIFTVAVSPYGWLAEGATSSLALVLPHFSRVLRI